MAYEGLSIFARPIGPQHGFAIAQWVESASGGNILIEDSALYTACTRWKTPYERIEIREFLDN